MPTLPTLPTLLTEEWWSSWRRANAAGWDYLNAVSGLVRLPLNFVALAGATGFPSPFPRP